MDKKMLKEGIKKQIQEELQAKKTAVSKLSNRWKTLIESKEHGEIKKSDYSQLAVMLENQHVYAVKEAKRYGMNALTESNISDTSSVQPYLKILVPILRRSYKLMSAMELVGNQPLSAPQGYIYALRFMYAGDDKNRLNKPSNLDRLQGTELEFMSYATSFEFTSSTFQNIEYKSADRKYTYIIKSTTNAPNTELDTKSLADLKTDATAIIYGSVDYAESNLSGDVDGGVNNVSTDKICKVAINRYVDGVNVAPIIDPAIDITTGDNKLWLCNFDTNGDIINKHQIKTIFITNKNEMGFDFIFKNYTGGNSTIEAQYQGSSESDAVPYRSLKLTIERKNIETKSRKLKVQYPDEMYEDLKNMHGLNASEELTKMAEIEIANEINAMILQAIYQTATQTKGWTYGKAGIIQQGDVSGSKVIADGLRQSEKFETLATKIRHEANQIGKETRRGAGNYCIVTVNVLTALQSTTQFSPAGGDDLLISGLSYAGMLGKMKIYVDTYNVLSGDFVLVGYKGANNNMDAGIVFSSYIPLQVKKAIDPNTLQDVIGFRTRCGITTSLYGAYRYYRMFSVDLTGSMISNT